MTDPLYGIRVADGAALLDDVAPGWTETIDLSALDINRCDRCVLGQIYGNYIFGVDAIWGPGHEDEWMRELLAVSYGFDIDFGAPPEDERAHYRRLTDEWRALISQRQKTVDKVLLST